MTDEELNAMLETLPEPELPAALARRLNEIPKGRSVRRFPARSWQWPAVGWAAAAMLGVFLGAATVEGDVADITTAPSASVVGSQTSQVEASDESEDATVALAVGSFAELEE